MSEFANQNTEAQAFTLGTLNESDPEVMAVKSAQKELAALERQFPDWFNLLEDTMPDVAPREHVVELMASAPNSFALGLLYGKYMMRLEIANMTHRDWL